MFKNTYFKILWTLGMIFTLGNVKAFSEETCNIHIAKHREYTGQETSIDSVSVPLTGKKRRCSERYVKKEIETKGCELQAIVAHLKNIKTPKFLGSRCFEADVYFYQDSVQHFTKRKNQSAPVDSSRVSNTGLRLQIKSGTHFLVGGNQQANSFFYTDDGDTLSALELQRGLGIALGYFYTENLGLFVEYDWHLLQAESVGFPKATANLYHKHGIRVLPVVNVYRALRERVRLNVNIIGGVTWNALFLMNDFKKSVRAQGIEPYNGAATGFGWTAGMGADAVFHVGLVGGVRVLFRKEYPKFSQASESIDGSLVGLESYIGYRF